MSELKNEEKTTDGETETERPRIGPDWKTEYFALLEYMNDVGLQFMINYKNIRAVGFTNWQKQQQQQQQQGR